MTDEIEKLRLSAQKLWDIETNMSYYGERDFSAEELCRARDALAEHSKPTSILAIIDRLKKAEAQREVLSSAYRSAAARAEKAEAERDAACRDKDGNHVDDLREWLDEARDENEAQGIAFHATSLRLKQAKAEIAAMREQKPVAWAFNHEDGKPIMEWGEENPWKSECNALALYASPIAAPMPATQPEAECCNHNCNQGRDCPNR